MKKSYLINIALSLALASIVTGCGQETNSNLQKNSTEITTEITTVSNNTISGENEAQVPSELEVCFGDDGEPFVMHLYDNQTTAMIAGYIGTGDLRLPIYHYDDYENYEVMQYYDIPTRYEIPSEPETITSEKAGEVYFAEPNRIVLFYKDAEISGEYTKIGYFDYSDEFLSAVENNPVLEGWGNKIILIRNKN